MPNLTSSSSSSSSTFLRQLSVTGNHNSSATSSRHWLGFDSSSSSSAAFTNTCSGCHLPQMEALDRIEGGGRRQGCGLMMRKRIMVVVNKSSHSRHAMIWALTHVANKGDLLTLLHVVPPPYDRDTASSHHSSSSYSSSSLMTVTTNLVNSLGSLCKDCKPEVEVEALVIQDPRMATVMCQVKKLDVSVLVLGQKRRSQLIRCLCGGSIIRCGGWEEFVEDCIDGADCLTIGVRKQSRGVGGYLISTRWQKKFWLLA